MKLPIRKVLFLIALAFVSAGDSASAQDLNVSEVTTRDGIKIRYTKDGTGLPTIVVNGGMYKGIYSKELRKHLQLFFLDLRYSRENASAADIERVTLDTLVDDIEDTRRALGFEKIAVIGHSLPSLIALEYARKYPQHASHVILVGPPPFTITQAERDAFWTGDASEARKAADRRNLEKISEEELKKLPPGRAWAMQNVRTAARYWFDPSYDPSWIWENVTPNMNLMRQVGGVVFRGYDVSKRKPPVTAPVFIALGRFDYAVPYHVWNDRKQVFTNVSVNLFERSGHYPMLEEHSAFDRKLIQWIKKR